MKWNSGHQLGCGRGTRKVHMIIGLKCCEHSWTSLKLSESSGTHRFRHSATNAWLMSAIYPILSSLCSYTSRLGPPWPFSFKFEVFSVTILTLSRVKKGEIPFTVENLTYLIIEKVTLMRPFSPCFDPDRPWSAPKEPQMLEMILTEVLISLIGLRVLSVAFVDVSEGPKTSKIRSFCVDSL